MGYSKILAWMYNWSNQKIIGKQKKKSSRVVWMLPSRNLCIWRKMLPRASPYLVSPDSYIQMEVFSTTVEEEISNDPLTCAAKSFRIQDLLALGAQPL
mmetsp:Transcript_3956/g.11462  ORF Transcript_3956/g.11462 Transcript_3956/m.11462 type:complete len:98 (+) Transcript_3956:350-643(+)